MAGDGEGSRQRVLEAARSAWSADPGASLGAIAAAAGVSRSTLHRVGGTRAELLERLALEPDPSSRQRVLAAALELIGRDGLSGLSMDELAAAAGLSRASLYRLFPGKAALFRGLILAFSPVEPVRELLRRMGGRPPEEVVPEIARAVASTVGGREGLVRTLLFEATASSPDTAEAVEHALAGGFSDVAAYMHSQMAQGRLRRTHPLLAVQALVGPLMLHLLARPPLRRSLGVELPLEESLLELARTWLRAMRPGPEDGA